MRKQLSSRLLSQAPIQSEMLATQDESVIEVVRPDKKAKAPEGGPNSHTEPQKQQATSRMASPRTESPQKNENNQSIFIVMSGHKQTEPATQSISEEIYIGKDRYELKRIYTKEGNIFEEYQTLKQKYCRLQEENKSLRQQQQENKSATYSYPAVKSQTKAGLLLYNAQNQQTFPCGSVDQCIQSPEVGLRQELHKQIQQLKEQVNRGSEDGSVSVSMLKENSSVCFKDISSINSHEIDKLKAEIDKLKNDRNRKDAFISELESTNNKLRAELFDLHYDLHAKEPVAQRQLLRSPSKISSNH